MRSSLASYRHTYGCHYITQDDIDAVVEVLKSDQLTCGQKVIDFEDSLKSFVQSKFAVSCSNGTTALHLASLAIGLKPGDVVIVPSITFLATANAARYCGAEVVFCDVDEESGLMRVEHLEEAFSRCSKKPKAVFPVHLAGQTVDMLSLSQFARSHEMYIIEDACHAFGSSYEDENGSHKVGDCFYSDLTTFSFHPVKNIATGEGGAITTNNDSYVSQMKCFRSHGMLRDFGSFENKDLGDDCDGNANPWYYEMQSLGYNYRLTDIQAALGQSQLLKINQFKEHRSSLKKHYDDLLLPYHSFIRPIRAQEGSSACWHLYSVLIDFKTLNIKRSVVMKKLAALGIGSQVHYIPVHLQPYYANIQKVNLPGAMSYYEKTLSLPLHVKMSQDDVAIIVKNLLEVVGLV